MKSRSRDHGTTLEMDDRNVRFKKANAKALDFDTCRGDASIVAASVVCCHGFGHCP
jgi:hypothetical protein